MSKHPGWHWLAPEFKVGWPTVAELAEQLRHSVSEDCKLPMNFEDRRWYALWKCGVHSHLKSAQVYRMPYLSQDACNVLHHYSKSLQMQPNEQEDVPYQIDELVLAGHGDGTMYELLLGMHNEFLRPVWELAFGLHPNDPQSIQLARYKPGVRGMTNWHYDASSECTTTVVLSPDHAYEGGGMQVFPGIDLGPAKQGHATMFQGRNLLHRSTPVLEGDRTLLVHWFNHKCGDI